MLTIPPHLLIFCIGTGFIMLIGAKSTHSHRKSPAGSALTLMVWRQVRRPACQNPIPLIRRGGTDGKGGPVGQPTWLKFTWKIHN